MHKHTHAANLVLYNAVTIFVQLIHQRLHCLIAHVNAAGPEAPNDLVHGQAAITVLVELEKQIREAKLQGGMEWLGREGGGEQGRGVREGGSGCTS